MSTPNSQVLSHISQRTLLSGLASDKSSYSGMRHGIAASPIITGVYCCPCQFISSISRRVFSLSCTSTASSSSSGGGECSIQLLTISLLLKWDALVDFAPSPHLHPSFFPFFSSLIDIQYCRRPDAAAFCQQPAVTVHSLLATCGQWHVMQWESTSFASNLGRVAVADEIDANSVTIPLLCWHNVAVKQYRKWSILHKFNWYIIRQ